MPQWRRSGCSTTAPSTSRVGWRGPGSLTSLLRAEAAAFVHGDGYASPRGPLSNLIVPNEFTGWWVAGLCRDRHCGGFQRHQPGRHDRRLVYALGRSIWAGASFADEFHNRGRGCVKMKYADWAVLVVGRAGGGGTGPARWATPCVYLPGTCPTSALDAMAIGFGGFPRRLHHRGTARSCACLRAPFSAKPHVLFYAIKRVGGRFRIVAAIIAEEGSPPAVERPGGPELFRTPLAR